MTMINQVIAYEQGELDEEGIIDMFQQLINSGLKGFQSAAGKIIDGVMYLDCKTWDWVEIGSLKPNYLSIIKNAKTKIYNQSGYFISDGEDVYWFNFSGNYECDRILSISKAGFF